MMKRLRAKEDEIEKIGKLNWALEEKVKSLCMENQIWEMGFLSPRSKCVNSHVFGSNLEQVLSSPGHKERTSLAGLDDQAKALMDDAQSCCGANHKYLGLIGT
ncbi:hypothetical protein OIU84_024173 [Salix udensis]|uniref:Uncharacterized protein n=1 Tax=Salix udensis TaxID=889485 RepID=A0AAD6KIU3_9ROSI|nr:hypothetical protein OIU84_024173 [Salix udensis]